MTSILQQAERGLSVSREDRKEQEPGLRARLLESQTRLKESNSAAIVLFSGVDGAGKGESANRLTVWMDPRRVATHAYGELSDEERERPQHWRFWRDLPPRGTIGLFLSAWYHRPLLDRVYEDIDEAEFDHELTRIAHLEEMLAADGALLVKFWMHLGREKQKQRLEKLEADPLTSWRVTRQDWKHWRLYDRFAAATEHLIERTHTDHAPWTVIEGYDQNYRELTMGQVLLESIETHLEGRS